MNELRRRVDPTTNVANWSVTNLVDYLQETLGVGDFAGEPPEYLGWRMRQVGLLKRVMKHRSVSIQEMVMCADYCKAHRIQPETVTGLLYHINEARRWLYSKKKAAIQDEFVEALAVEQQRALSDEGASRWVDMLLRATGPKKEEVLLQWQKERG